jgi:hypothetical protein
MIATAFLGSLTFMLGVSRFVHGQSNFNVIHMIEDPVSVQCGSKECYLLGLGWVVIGTLGLIVQVGGGSSSASQVVACRCCQFGRTLVRTHTSSQSVPDSAAQTHTLKCPARMPECVPHRDQVTLQR